MDVNGTWRVVSRVKRREIPDSAKARPRSIKSLWLRVRKMFFFRGREAELVAIFYAPRS